MSSCSCRPQCAVSGSCLKKQGSVIFGFVLCILGIACLSYSAVHWNPDRKTFVIIGSLTLTGGVSLLICGIYFLVTEHVLKQDVTKTRRRQRKKEIVRNVYLGPSVSSDQASLVPLPTSTSPNKLQHGIACSQTMPSKGRIISESEGSNLRFLGGAVSGNNLRFTQQGRRPSTAGGRFQMSTDFQSYSTVMSPASTFPVMSHSTLPSMPSCDFPSVFSLPLSRTDPSGDMGRAEHEAGRRPLNRHLALSAPLLASNSKRKNQQNPCYWRGPIDE